MYNENISIELMEVCDREEQIEISTATNQDRLFYRSEYFHSNRALPQFKRISLNEPFPINKSLAMGKPVFTGSPVITLNLFFQTA